MAALAFSGRGDLLAVCAAEPDRKLSVWKWDEGVKIVDADLYRLLVVSSRNYFLFTPMLAASSVGKSLLNSFCSAVEDILRFSTDTSPTFASTESVSFFATSLLFMLVFSLPPSSSSGPT